MDPNILSRRNGEYNWLKCIGHVTGDEKYEWLTLNDVVREINIRNGSVLLG